jgi:hypothetical protein
MLMESIKILDITAHIKGQICGSILNIAKCTQDPTVLGSQGIEGNM